LRSSRFFRNAGFWRVAVLSVAIAAVSPDRPVHAADPERAFSQYLRDRWERSAGFGGGEVYAITQTRDGYLWIAAEKGLVRFDGLRFHLFQPLEPTSSTDTAAVNVVPDRGGGLWTWLRRNALMHLHNGAFENALKIPGPPDPRVGTMAPGIDGSILIADVRLGLLVSRDGRVETVLDRASLPRLITTIAQTPNGDIWLGTRDAGLVRVTRGQVTAAASVPLKQKINCLAADEQSGLWIGTDNGIFRWHAGDATPAPVAAEVGQARALAMIRDRDANVWIGTSDALVRIDRRGTMSVERRRESAAVTALFEDREGNLWIGDSSGIERWRDGAFASMASVDPVMAGGIGPVYSAGDRVWFAPASGGLYWFRDGRTGTVAALRDEVIYSIAGEPDGVVIGRQRGGMTRVRARGDAFATETFTERDGLAQNQVFTIQRARDGTVWAGTLSRGVSRLKDGGFATYTTADGLASNTVAAVVDTADGAVWFATPNGASVKLPQEWRRYSTADGLPSNDVNTLFEDSARNLWIGTAAGLAVAHDGRIQSLSGAPASLRASIVGLTDDPAGGLWIAARDRVLRVDRERLLHDAVAAGDVREFSAADGLLDTGTIKRQRVLMTDSRGRVWLATNGGLAVADTRRVAAGLPPSIVQVEELLADGAVVDQTPTITVPARRGRLTFVFAGLSLSVPDRVRFRYRLDGFDRDWSEPVTERQAAFTNLGPGAYRFRVIASNSDGAWSDSGATVDFAIAPAYYQTVWFLALSAGTLVAVVWGAHRVRLRIVEKHEREISTLNERLMKAQEQERMRIAGELHDGVMQEMVAVTMMLGTAKRRAAANPDAQATIDKVQQKLIQVGSDIRQLSHELHPPLLQEAGLPKAIQTYCEQFAATSGIPVSCDADETAADLSRGAALALFRIAQEALGNAAKHAAAKRIAMRLSRSDGMVSLVVTDDGAGFDRGRIASTGGLGLIMMRERATQLNGRFDIESAPGRGTTIRVVVPFR
jgi:signal transduction histidine kinase/ligand-binding sensor domain-containing protein